jgi:hypothetical protein
MVRGLAVLLPALSVLADGLPSKIIPRIFRASASSPGPYLGVNEPGKLTIGKRRASGCAGGDDHNPLPPPYGRCVALVRSSSV